MRKSDPISREKAIKEIKEKAMRPDIQRNADTVNGLLGAMNIIYDLPTSERVGKWIEHEWAEEYEGRLISNYECSECKSWKREMTNYCPDCGARMVKGEENE